MIEESMIREKFIKGLLSGRSVLFRRETWDYGRDGE